MQTSTTGEVSAVAVGRQIAAATGSEGVFGDVRSRVVDGDRGCQRGRQDVADALLERLGCSYRGSGAGRGAGPPRHLSPDLAIGLRLT